VEAARSDVSVLVAVPVDENGAKLFLPQNEFLSGGGALPSLGMAIEQLGFVARSGVAPRLGGAEREFRFFFSRHS